MAQKVALRGQVTDESGALIPAARVVLNGPAGLTKQTRAGGEGSYLFADLTPGAYTLRASAPQLILLAPVSVSLGASAQTVNLVLSVSAEKQEVTVEDNAGAVVSTDAAANASAVVLRGTDLDALSDNPDDLAADLQALAGPAAGPNGGAVFIDGFSGGEMPPKNSIREIRINQNPFSPEYDKLGFGRVEIFTKPGTEKFHADLGYNFANDKWNSRNPYSERKAPFRLNELRETVSGPLSKRASFNLNFIREWVDNGNIVNGVILAPVTLAVQPFTDTPVAELRRTGATSRVDYQLSTNHTLSVRYVYNREIVHDAGTGSLNLVSRGYHNDALSQTAQVTETAVLSTSVVNETRFQFFHPTMVSTANSAGPAIQVLGAFNGGGNPMGRTTDAQNNYELQNNTSVIRGAHTVRFGVRLRGTTEKSISPQNFGGTFTFAGSPGVSSIESYRLTLLYQQMGLSAAEIRQRGGGAAQFSINGGAAAINGRQIDAAVFAGDDWKIRPNVTMSLGLRHETQSNIHDWKDFAPRVGVAWAPRRGVGKSAPKSVIRAGFGMFYDRFPLVNALTAQRFDGLIQQQYIVTDPDFFPVVPAATGLPGTTPSSTIQQISGTLRAPYFMQSAVSFERQLPFHTTVAVTYANAHGLHMLRSRSLNAPLPGSGLYPLGRPGLVVQMESSGLYNQNQLILSVNSKVSRRVSLMGSYGYGRANSNTDGLSTFPANPYSMAGEYGPAAIDMHHRVSLSGTVTTMWGIRLNPLLTANTGLPFDITAGQDLYGDTLFNGRPGLATDASRPGVVRTAYGLL
ncbi:MAG: carboxypeptidase regulatory-like domain-containing protein, partial [Bryobacteraceae bacterium]